TTSVPLNANGEVDPNGEYKSLPPEREGARQRMINRRILEEYVEFLSPLYLPHTLRVFASDCNGRKWDSPHYDPYLHAINMCYSYILASEKEADWFVEYQKNHQLPTPVSHDQYLAGLFVAVLLHETGHA